MGKVQGRLNHQQIISAHIKIHLAADRWKDMDAKHSILLAFDSLNHLAVFRQSCIFELQRKSGVMKSSPGFHLGQYEADQPNGGPLG